MNQQFVFRKPEAKDAYLVWNLVKKLPPLELNSLYFYLIFCTHFSQTSIVVEDNNNIISYISGHLVPTQPDALFVWQIGVHKEYRRKGLAYQMLEQLKKRLDKKIKSIWATFTPSNLESKNFFIGFAKKQNLSYEIKEYYKKKLFGITGHEEELLIQIKM